MVRKLDRDSNPKPLPSSQTRKEETLTRPAVDKFMRKILEDSEKKYQEYLKTLDPRSWPGWEKKSPR
jgi:hypothetical protein